MKIALIADTHLAANADDFVTNCDRAIDWINASEADLVIHLGDVSADGVRDPAHLRAAAATLSRLRAPLLAVPGNHDIGEPTGDHEPPFSSERLTQFRRIFGADRWLKRVEDWTLIGFDTQLPGTHEEAEQTDWLRAAADACDGPVALFLHKPWFLTGPDDTAPASRYVPPAALTEIGGALGDVDLRLVLSGHMHQYRRHIVHGVEHAWIGSTAFLIPERWQETIGEKRVGIALLTLDRDGHSLEDVTPAGMRALDLADYADVYPELRARG